MEQGMGMAVDVCSKLQTVINTDSWSLIAMRLPLLLLLLLAFLLPFELDTPLWRLGPLAITNIELILFMLLVSTAVFLWQSRAKWRWPDRSWWWLLLFSGGLLLSALMAPQLKQNGIKAAFRLLTGGLLAMAVVQLIRRPRNGRFVMLALLGGGIIASFLGWWELSQAELAWVGLFRSHITRVGAFLRLTGPFDYANQAAMFIEATLPFLVAAGWTASQKSLPRRIHYPLMLLLLLATTFYLQAAVLTLSRASFATIIAVCLLLAVWLLRWQPQRRKMVWWWLGLALLTAVLTAANSFLNSQLRLRLQAGNVDDWYRTQIVAPATLEIPAAASVDVPLAITNEGALVWRSQGENPISLGARWINQAGNQVYGELRWPFADRVKPQETVQMSVPLQAPPDAGTYELRWDVVHENVTWFGSKSGIFATSLVTVLPSNRATEAEPAQPAGDERAAWQYGGPVPDRMTLWRVALQMVAERPLLGIGLDNFRLTYGARLGDPNYDNTVHTNNFYLEMLVSTGIIGALPFFLWLLALLFDLLRTLRHPHLTIWQVALAAGLLSYLIHGLLDFFLLFNATGLLFWLLVGLWISEKRHHAYRI